MIFRAGSRVSTRHIVLLCAYLLVAAASFCGMYAKHGFGLPGSGAELPAMLDGTADRPYVYRQLLPAMANLGEKIIPRGVQERFVAHLALDAPAHSPLRNTFTRAANSDNPRYALRYYIVYGLAFAGLLAAMFVLRAICLDMTGDEAASTIAPLAFALAVPASYYYDFPELFFMTLGVWLALRGKALWLIPLTLVATFNKESFPFFVLALYPFLRERVSRRTTLLCLGACFALGAAVNVLVKLEYAGNAGAPALINLWFNLRFFADPRNYLLTEWTYGLLMPKGVNVLILFVLFVLVRAGWGGLPTVAKRHALFVAAINVPLFLALGYADEVRALSMIDVSAVLIVCVALARYLERAAQPATVPAGRATAQSGDSRTRDVRSKEDHVAQPAASLVKS